MKKLIYIVSIFVALCTSACSNDIDIWDSETLEYSGRYLFELFSEDMEDKYYYFEDGGEIQIYNTAQNVKNEVWIDDINHIFPFKSKFFFDGDPNSFKSRSSDFTQLTDNEYSSFYPDEDPESAEDRYEDVQEYTRCYINEGKIIPAGATTIGGNKADSIYVKITLCSNDVVFKSEFIPEDDRTDPEVAYRWILESSEYNPEYDETYVISGHAYTGFPEDRY